MNENYKISPQGYEAILRAKSKKEVLTYIHDALLKEYGAAPSIAELNKFYSDENAVDIPGFTSEQQTFAMVKMVEHSTQNVRKLNRSLVQLLCEDACDYDEDNE